MRLLKPHKAPEPGLGHAFANRLTGELWELRCQPALPCGPVPRQWRSPYMPRAITIFMISFDPPKMRLTRLSRNMRAMG